MEPNKNKNKKNNTKNNKNNKKNNKNNKNNKKHNTRNNTNNNNRRTPSPIFYMNSPNRKFLVEKRLPNTPQSVNSSTNTIKHPSPEIIQPFVFNKPPKILRSLMNDKNLF
jgi:hypothetical protein